MIRVRRKQREKEINKLLFSPLCYGSVQAIELKSSVSIKQMLSIVGIVEMDKRRVRHV